MAFKEKMKDGTTRLTGAQYLSRADGDSLYLPKYQEYDSGWIYVGGGGTAPAFQNGTSPYGINHAVPRFRRIGDVVYMEGLVSNPPAGYGVIFNLPVGFRPGGSGDLIPASFGNGCTEGHGVRVYANGNVVTGTSVTGWTSMTCQFPVAGAATPWHVIGAAGEPTFGAGWSNVGGNWQTARFMKIGDFTYLSGVVQRLSGSVTTIFTLPTAYAMTNLSSHTPCAAQSTMSGSDFGVNISNLVSARAVGSNTGYVSLDGIRFYSGPANDAKWRKYRGGAEGWFLSGGWYGAGWPYPAIRRDGKIIHMEGLTNIPATGNVIKLPLGYAPGQQLVLPIVNSANRRVDLTPMNIDDSANSAGVWQTGGTGVNGFTHSWVVAETFEGDIRWNS